VDARLVHPGLEREEDDSAGRVLGGRHVPVEQLCSLEPVDVRVLVAGDAEVNVHGEPEQVEAEREPEHRPEPESVLRPPRVGERDERDERLDQEPRRLLGVQPVRVAARPEEVLGRDDPDRARGEDDVRIRREPAH